jgi:hypothetical protein
MFKRKQISWVYAFVWGCNGTLMADRQSFIRTNICISIVCNYKLSINMSCPIYFINKTAPSGRSKCKGIYKNTNQILHKQC